MLTEAQGCQLLAAIFKERGHPVARDVDFDAAGVAFNIDGWCASSRVGFEYRTHGDKSDLTHDELMALGTAMEQGLFYIFVIDEDDVGTADDLRQYANAFLDEVERRSVEEKPALRFVAGPRAASAHATPRGAGGDTSPPEQRTKVKP